MKFKKHYRLFAPLIFVLLLIIAWLGYQYFPKKDDFSKGVLALNIPQSGYSPNEPVLFQAASLDAKGNTLCNSKLELEVVPPHFIFAKKTVAKIPAVVTNTCSTDNNVTNEPDYIARYTPQKPGKYQVTLTNKSTQKKIKSSFVVTDKKPALQISRWSATRINPFKSQRYPMVISVTANQDFSGTAQEVLPAGFQVIWHGGSTLENNQLSWKLNLKKGETIKLQYDYAAPKKSPDLILVPSLKILDSAQNTKFKSVSWSIASDATYTATGNGEWNTNATWGGTGHPVAGDIANIGAYTITVSTGNAAATTVYMTASGATINVSSPYSLTISGVISLYKQSAAATTGTVTGTGTMTAGTITVGTSTNSPTSNNTTYAHTFVSTIASLNVTNITINSYFASTNRYRNGVFSHQSGTVTVSGTITTSNANGSNSATYTLAAGAQTGTLALTAASPWSASGTGTTNFTLNGTSAVVNYSGSVAQSILATTYTTLKSNNTNAAGAALAGNTTVKNLTIGDVNSNSVFSDGGYTLTPSGTTALNVSATGTYQLGSAGTATSWATWSSTTLTAGSTIEYAAGVAQTISATPTYSSLKVSGNSTKTLGGAITVNNNLTISAGTLADGGNQITGNATGTLSIASGATLSLGNGSATTFPTNFTAAHISLDAASTVIYKANANTTISATPTYGGLTLAPTLATSGKTYTFSGAATINGDFMINPAGNQLLTVNPAGAITVASGKTTTIQASDTATATLDLRPASSDYNLSTGLLVLGTGGTLDCTSSAATITLTGTSDTLFTNTGTFTITSGTPTVIYNGTGSSINPTLTSGNITFYNLTLSPNNSSGHSYTFGTGTHAINGDFNITPSGSALLTVNMAGNISVAAAKTTTISRSNTATSSLVTSASNPSLSTGNLVVAAGGTLDGTGSSSVITVSANSTPFSMSGTFTPGSTTFTYAPGATTGVTLASTTYHHLTLNKASNTFSLTAGGITTDSGGNLTLSAGTLDTVSGSNFPITIGGGFTNSGTFLAQQGTFTLNTASTPVTITGATTFYNFASSVSSKTIQFADGQTFRFDGQLALSNVTLDNVTSSQWLMNLQGTYSLTAITVNDAGCDASSKVINLGTGNNGAGGTTSGSCWFVPPSPTPSPIPTPSPAPDQGILPLLYWRFDEAQGTTTNDSTGNSRAGTLVNTPSWKDASYCKNGSCLQFVSSSSEYVNYGSAVSGVHAVSFWIKPLKPAASSSILSLDGAAGTATLSVSNVGVISAGAGITQPTFYVNSKKTNRLAFNTWQFVTVATNLPVNATNIMLGRVASSYFDGFIDEFKVYSYPLLDFQVSKEQVSKGSVMLSNTDFSDSNNNVASDATIAHWSFDAGGATEPDLSGNGMTLTPQGSIVSAAGKFNKSASYDGSSYYNYSTTSTTNYRIDAHSGTSDSSSGWTGDASAFDSSTSTYANWTGIASTLTGRGTNAPASGDTITQVEVRFYASNDDQVVAYIRSADTTQLLSYALTSVSPTWTNYMPLNTPTGGWTWDTLQNLYASFVPSGSASTARVYYIDLRVTTSASSTVTGTKSVSFWANTANLANYFLNLSATANIQSNASGVISANGFTNPQIYVNGVLGATLATGSWQLITVSSDTTVSSDDFTIGKIGSSYYTGSIDDVRLYDQPISSADALKLYNWAPGPIAYWKMDENSGTTLYDSSGNSNNSSSFAITGNWKPGVYGSGFNFTGGDFSITPTSASLSNLGAIADSLTVSAWFKTSANYTTGGINGCIIDKSSVDIPEIYPLRLCVTGAGNTLGGGVLDGSNPVWITSPTVVNDGVWHYGTLVRDVAQDKILLYLDGVLQASATDTTATTLANADDIYIGSSMMAENFIGQIDDAKIYNYARTPAQIVQDMNAGNMGPGSPVGSSLVYWKFDEGYGTTYSNSGTTGSTTAATASAAMAWSSSAKYGKAISFNGTTAFASTTKQALMAANAATYNNLSWSAWINPATSAVSKSILVKDNEYRLTTDANSKANCAIYSGSWQTAAIADTALPVNSWSHVLCVYNGTTISVYLNGRLAGTAAQTGNLTSSNTTGVNLGWNAAGGSYFNGLMDDIKISATAFNAAQAQILANMSSVAVLGSTTATDATSQPSFMSNGLIGYWKMDDNTGTSTVDSSGNGKTLSFNNSPTWGNGKYGAGIVGNGTTTYLSTGVSDPDSIHDMRTGSFSAFSWIKAAYTSDGTSDLLFYKGGGGSGDIGWSIWIGQGTGRPLIYISDGSTLIVNGLTSTKSVADSTWHYVGFTWDPKVGAKLYIDGELSNSQALTSTVDINSALPLYLGGHSSSNFSINGTLDEARIYNRALSPVEAQQLYLWAPGPVGEWKLDEGTLAGASAIKDSSGNNYHGTNTGTYSLATGKFGNAAFYNNGYTNITPNPSGNPFSPNTTGKLSVSYWLYPTACNSSTTPYALSKSGTGYEWSAGLENWGTCLATVRLWNTTTADYMTITSTTAISLNTWYHIEWVFDKSVPRLSLYVNGVKEAEDTSAVGTLQTPQTDTLRFGKDPDANTYYGRMDNIKIYNYARSPEQVAWDYNGGAPVAQYNFSECTGTTINNSAVGANGASMGYTGTLNLTGNAAGTCSSSTVTDAWYLGKTGKFGSALGLDGNDYVSLATTANLAFNSASQNFSVFAYVKRAATGATHTVVSKEDASGDGWNLVINSNNTFSCNLGNSGNVAITSAATVDTNWHHIGCSIDKSGNGQAYIDGRPTGAAVAIGSKVLAVASATTAIGATNYTTRTNYFNGLIDALYIYNYALNPIQVQTLANNNSSVRFGQ